MGILKLKILSTIHLKSDMLCNFSLFYFITHHYCCKTGMCVWKRNWCIAKLGEIIDRMEKLDKMEEEKSELELAKVPPVTVINPVTECEMDALLLGRIGVSNY